MLCDTKIILLTLLGFLAALAWGAEDSPTNGKEKVSAVNSKKLARKQYRAANFWGRRAGSTRNKPGRYYGDDDDDEDEDEDDSGYYGDSYGSYQQSYAPSYAPQVIQIPQVQSYYQQQQPSIIPYPSYQSYGGGYHKKKKKRPICCCSTAKCLEACDPATNTDCACDMRCCARYSTTNPGCASAAAGRQVIFLRKFDNLLSEEYNDEEIPEEE